MIWSLHLVEKKKVQAQWKVISLYKLLSKYAITFLKTSASLDTLPPAHSHGTVIFSRFWMITVLHIKNKAPFVVRKAKIRLLPSFVAHCFQATPPLWPPWVRKHLHQNQGLLLHYCHLAFRQGHPSPRQILQRRPYLDRTVGMEDQINNHSRVP